MHGLHTKISSRCAEDGDSKFRHTIPEDGALSYDEQTEVAGMIWEEELKRGRRKREWIAFYLGCAFTAMVFFLVAMAVTRLTGGVEGCP